MQKTYQTFTDHVVCCLLSAVSVSVVCASTTTCLFVARPRVVEFPWSWMNEWAVNGERCACFQSECASTTNTSTTNHHFAAPIYRRFSRSTAQHSTTTATWRLLLTYLSSTCKLNVSHFNSSHKLFAHSTYSTAPILSVCVLPLCSLGVVFCAMLVHSHSHTHFKVSLVALGSQNQLVSYSSFWYDPSTAAATTVVDVLHVSSFLKSQF